MRSWKLCQLMVLVMITIGCLYLSFSQNYRAVKDFIQNPPEMFQFERELVLNISSLHLTLNPLARPDVQTETQWGAPILWEGTFDPTLFDEAHKMAGTSVALTVFAVGRYLEVYLKAFLLSADKHFMTGLPVTYYVFTERPEEVPEVEVSEGRGLRVLLVEKLSRWQDVSMMRMKSISETIQREIRLEHSHVFCFDVDQVFTGRWGSEALGDSVAQIHSGYYRSNVFTYDRNPKSRAYMKTGDFYYHAAIFGGRWQKVQELVDFCYQSIMEDKNNQVEALWHDESHLNKFFFLNKPTRLLSPEYCWSPANGNRGEDVHIHRLEWAPKYYDKLRT